MLRSFSVFSKTFQLYAPYRLHLGNRVFKKFHSLTKTDSDTTAHALVGILKRANLEKIILRRGPTKRQLKTFFGSCTSLPSNPSLQSLSLKAHSPAIIVCLGTATASLRRLVIYLEDPELRVSDHVQRFKNLIRLHMNVRKEGIGIASGDFDTLRVMTQLEVICITSCSAMTPHDRLSVGWLGDGYFDSWIEKVPCLHRLQLTWECDLSQAALVSIARSSPELVTWATGRKHDSRTWNSLLTIAPLFPKLRILRLGDIGSLISRPSLEE